MAEDYSIERVPGADAVTRGNPGRDAWRSLRLLALGVFIAMPLPMALDGVQDAYGLEPFRFEWFWLAALAVFLRADATARRCLKAQDRTTGTVSVARTVRACCLLAFLWVGAVLLLMAAEEWLNPLL